MKSKEPARLQASRIFGVPLEDAVLVSAISLTYPLPAVVFRCIQYLEAHRGISFRLFCKNNRSSLYRW